MTRNILAATLAALAGFALAGCQHDPMEQTEASLVAVNERAGHAFGPEISAEDFAAHIRVLASDEFGGREPGSEGEEKTVSYLRDQFQRLGLEPGNGDSYFQTVPMLETRSDPASTSVSLSVGGKARAMRFGDDMVVSSRTGAANVHIGDAPVVFVGYGVNAPEVGWNDYAGVDVKDKVVVMFINDPGFHSGDPTLFEGRRMTYYGRWTYKFEEAARQGAAAAIIIHDTAGASYGWDVVKNSWSGAQFDLLPADDPAPRLPLQGWITGEAAASLFSDAGLDLDQLRLAANLRGFEPVALGAKLSVDLNSQIHE